MPSNPDLRDQSDTNLRFLDDTRPKTALVIIDDGRGAPKQLRIATNVDRADDGTRAGIDLSQALSNAGVVCRVDDEDRFTACALGPTVPFRD